MSELDAAYRARLRAALHDLAGERPAPRGRWLPAAVSGLAAIGVGIAAVVLLVPQPAEVRVACLTSAAPVDGGYEGVDVTSADDCAVLWADGALVAPPLPDPASPEPGGALTEEALPELKGQSAAGPQSAPVLSQCEIDDGLVVVIPAAQVACSLVEADLLEEYR